MVTRRKHKYNGVAVANRTQDRPGEIFSHFFRSRDLRPGWPEPLGMVLCLVWLRGRKRDGRRLLAGVGRAEICGSC